MVGVLAKDIHRDGVGALEGRHVADALVQAKQRQRVQQRGLVVVRVLGRQALDGRGVRGVAVRLGPSAVQNLDGLEIVALARCARLGVTGGGRPEPRQRGASRVGVLNAPDGVVEGHRFAPPRHGESRVEAFRFAKGRDGARGVEEVHQQRSAKERLPR